MIAFRETYLLPYWMFQNQVAFDVDDEDAGLLFVAEVSVESRAVKAFFREHMI